MDNAALIFSALERVSPAEIAIVAGIAVLAYAIFNKFEKHMSFARRVIKLLVLIGVLSVVGYLCGRVVFWGLIVAMTIGQVVLHGWYFPKQGINGLTAEPYERYLELIRHIKGEKNVGN